MTNHVTFKKTQDEIKIENIQHVYLNGKESTIFKLYVKEYTPLGNENFIFKGSHSLKGTIKRASTIKRKICL